MLQFSPSYKIIEQPHAAGGSENELQVREIRSLDELEELRPEWNALLQRTSRPDVYRTYEWLTTWWETHATANKRLLVLVVNNRERILGIAPLMEVTMRWMGLEIRKIEFLSMMRYAFSPLNISGSLDFIIAERHNEVIRAIMQHLAQNSRRWHYIRLHPIPERSVSLATMRQVASSMKLQYSERRVLLNARITDARTWEQYSSRLSPGFRKTLRRKWNTLQVTGSVAVQEHHETGAGAEELYAKLLEIEQRSWKRKKGISIGSAAYKNFYRTVFARALERGWLRFWTLDVNGQSLAYDFGLCYNGQVEILKGSYDHQFKKYSAGHLLLREELKQYINAGISYVNLLWGDLPYKLKWANDLDPHCEIYLFNRSLFCRLVYLVYIRSSCYRLVRFVRNLSERTRGTVPLS